jgi:DNA-binding NtrC family response regulator
VRELRNRIQRALLVAAGPAISPADLGLAEGAGPERFGSPEEPGLRPAMGPDDETERARIEAVLRTAGGVVARAAAQLGLSRQALYRKMDRLGITMERRPKG